MWRDTSECKGSYSYEARSSEAVTIGSQFIAEIEQSDFSVATKSSLSRYVHFQL